MPKYYLDIETLGLEPSTDKIVTIQYAEIDYITGEQKSELKILKECKSSEKDILLIQKPEHLIHADFRPLVYVMLPQSYHRPPAAPKLP